MNGVVFELIDNEAVSFTLTDPELHDPAFVFDNPVETFGFTLAEAVPGPPGRDGSITAVVVAGETLSGHRAIAIHVDGLAYYASNDEPSDATRQVWLSLGAAIEGTEVTLQPIGIVVEPSWNWTDAPVFLGTSGLLTQEPPTEPSFTMQLGQPTSTTSLMFNPRTPIVLV